MTKVHAYLARIKDQEKEVIAVPDGAGRALCVSFDKHWTLTREWNELHIIAPLVEGAAEARTTPAVTREEVWRVVAAHDPGDDEMALCRVNRLTDAVWPLVSGDDPAVHVVQESDVAAVEVKRNEQRDWWTPRRGYAEGATADGMRNMARIFLQDAADCEALARAIEAEDPIEARARELHKLAYPGENALEGAMHTCRKIAEAEAKKVRDA